METGKIVTYPSFTISELIGLTMHDFYRKVTGVYYDSHLSIVSMEIIAHTKSSITLRVVMDKKIHEVKENQDG